MNKQQPTEKELALRWWDSLSNEEAVNIQKDAGIYGHDEGVTESEIINFYKDL